MERFDEHLQFDLAGGYEVRRGTDGQGRDFFRILYRPVTGEDGQETAEAAVDVFDRGELAVPEGEIRLEGSFPAAVRSHLREWRILSAPLHILLCQVTVACPGHGYTLCCSKAGLPEYLPPKAESAALHLTAVLNGMVYDGRPAAFGAVTAEMLLKR